MGINLRKYEPEIDVGYEIYQIIRDFDNPIQIFREAFQNSIDEEATEVYCRVSIEQRLGGEDLIIDIWDNGLGMREENIPCFFGLAKSTKVTSKRMPTGKIGYKGHGTKIYFNSERIEIFSKPNKDEAGWGVVLEDPVKQIENTDIYRYSEQIDEKDCSIKLPSEYKTGFFVRIRNPYLFKTQHERYILNHLYLRDYAKWYTVFGMVKNLFNEEVPNVILYLQGLNIEYFQNKFNNINQIDPVPKLVEKDSQIFEELQMGHYFPPERKDDKSMKAYAQKIGSNKQYYDYYSREIYKNKVFLDNNISFNLIINVEGYETKRRYDVLLSRREKTEIDRSLQHTDGERYGLWACKGGVPIEKVDEWIIGGRGVGAYTYMHAFIDCDAFDLTANRGSVKNSDLEIIGQVKTKITEILNDKKIQNMLKEREAWETFEKTRRSIEEDSDELKERYKLSQNKRYIVLPNEARIAEPILTKSGYSESETFMLLMTLLSNYPDLFKFKILDYNTTKGIDFVVETGGYPKYIELKGTFRKKINHSFRNIYKFICYDTALTNNDVVEDVEALTTRLRINKDDCFESFDQDFNNKKFTSYQLIPDSTVIESMEVVVLKQLLSEVIGATLE
jgi:ASC-1-like (ASCH) protein